MRRVNVNREHEATMVKIWYSSGRLQFLVSPQVQPMSAVRKALRNWVRI